MTDATWIERLQQAWDDGLFILKPPELDPDGVWYDQMIDTMRPEGPHGSTGSLGTDTPTP